MDHKRYSTTNNALHTRCCCRQLLQWQRHLLFSDCMFD